MPTPKQVASAVMDERSRSARNTTLSMYVVCFGAGCANFWLFPSAGVSHSYGCLYGKHDAQTLAATRREWGRIWLDCVPALAAADQRVLTMENPPASQRAGNSDPSCEGPR